MKKILMCSFALLLLGCPASDGEQESSTGATQYNPGTVQKTSSGITLEQENIKRRIEVTTDPAKLMWMHLMSADGKIVSRMVVSGKITSSGKRLQPKEASAGGQYSHCPDYAGHETTEFIQPDGTYGSSDNYVFWFDPQGRYHQLSTGSTGISYLVTDYPIVLDSGTDPLTGMYALDKAAAEWAKGQNQ